MKPRRDITLGEMQDECRRRNAFCGDMGACPYRDFCHETVGDKCGWGDKGPRDWNLTDPPRFNEAQMAFWRGWYAIGARHAYHMIDIDRVYMFDGSGAFPKGQVLSTTVDTGLKKGETLDLAELLGRDGADDTKT